VANLPAEIAFLLEEIEAKDKNIQELRASIHAKDSNMQKFLKANGAGQSYPKEEQYCNSIRSNFDEAKRQQDQKVDLSEKAAKLVSIRTGLP
jgi:inhibitor of growth protein 3